MRHSLIYNHPPPARVAVAILLALLLTLVGVAAPTSPAAAQENETGNITIIENSAMADFPYNITFSLEAESNDKEIIAVELLYGATRHDAYTVVNADIIPGQRIEANHLLDTQVYHIPPGVDMSYQWLMYHPDGTTSTTPEQHLMYHDERFNWQQRTAQNVTVYWYNGNEDFGDELIETATRALEDLQYKIGAELSDPVNIYIYANTSDMYSAMRSNEAEWIGGQAHLSLGVIIGNITPGEDAEIGRLLPHELSHLVLQQATDNPYGGTPLWLHEGLAVSNQDTVERYFDFVLDDAALSGQLIPLEALSSSFPSDPDRAVLSYAESYHIVTYIIDTYGPDAMHEIVQAFGEGVTPDKALQEALGKTVEELDAEWRATLPPAQTNPDPTPTPQTTAPPDRFAIQPVAMPGGGMGNPAIPPHATMPDPTPAPTITLPQLSLPTWAQFGLVAGGCMVVITLLAGTLLVVLRLVGVDKHP